MVSSWGNDNARCWVSLFSKAKCISPQVRRARPAGTKSFTLALTAKRQQWIMFINQSHSSSGGTAQSKWASGSERCLPALRPEKKWHKWTLPLMLCTGSAARAASTETAVVKPHEAPLENVLLSLEKVAQPLRQPPWAARLESWAEAPEHRAGAQGASIPSAYAWGRKGGKG